MTKTLDKALQLNNTAVSLLLANNCKDAVTCLSEALTSIKFFLSSISTETVNNVHQRCHVEPNHDSFSLPAFGRKECFLFDQLIVFPLQQSCEDIAHIYSSGIILNIALAYHREYINGNKQCFEKAEKLYRMILKLLNRAENEGVALLIQFAALNNLSQLVQEQSNSDLATNGFKSLQRQLQLSGPEFGLFDDASQCEIVLKILITSYAQSVAPAA